jgi:hypothetical protein
MLIAVDFDGTIVPDHFFPHKEITESFPGAIRTLNDLADAGHTIILWTLRDSYGQKDRSLKLAVDFLVKNGFRRFGLMSSFQSMVKPPADVFIEDKVVGGFVGWDKVREFFKLPRI